MADHPSPPPAGPDAWDPEQYERFRHERHAPFFDLLALTQPIPGGRAADLGCGTGELTRLLHQHSGAAHTLGLDRSPAMLQRAAAHAGPTVTFVAGDLATFGAPACDQSGYDLILSNAALHWVTDHARVLRRWTSALRRGGQLAVQVPANADHPAHALVDAIAREEPFRSAFAACDGAQPPPDPVRGVLAPEAYAALLERLGYRLQSVRLQVYGHALPHASDVIEWLKGSTLTRLRGPLEARDPALYGRFLQRLRDAWLAQLATAGDPGAPTQAADPPYFYTFKRVLLWARLPA